VAGSTWLSAEASVPAASFAFCSRPRLQTGIVSPDRMRLSTAGTLSCGTVKTTATGCSCVMTTRPLVSPERTMLPGSTSRNPARPLTGALNARVGELQPGIVDLAVVDLHRALVLPHERCLGVDLLLRRSSPARRARGSARDRGARSPGARGRAQLALRLRKLNLERAGIDLGEKLALLDDLSSPNSTRMSSPSTRERTVTVRSGVARTQPS